MRAGKSSSQRSGLMPPVIPIADARAMSGGTTDIKYIDKTDNNANGSENFTPENQFLVLHSHISPKFRYMRVLIRLGAYAVNKRAPDRLIISASRTSSITSFFNASYPPTRSRTERRIRKNPPMPTAPLVFGLPMRKSTLNISSTQPQVGIITRSQKESASK